MTDKDVAAWTQHEMWAIESSVPESDGTYCFLYSDKKKIPMLFVSRNKAMEQCEEAERPVRVVVKIGWDKP
jgi:hypothetical protein